MKDLDFRISEIPKLVKLADSLSTIHEYPTGSTSRALQAEEIFNKFVLHLTSFKRNLPKVNEPAIDISVLASIARMIIEAHNILCYFCETSASKDEMDFKIWLYILHYSHDVLAILKKLEFTDADSIVSRFNMSGRMSISCLESNGYFKGLSEKEQKQLMLGHKAVYWRGQRPKRSPFPKETEEGIYKLLSNYVHSFPLGNTMYKGAAPLNHLNFENSAFVIVEVVVSYSASAILSYCSLRRKLGSRIPAREKAYLKDIATDRPIKEWLCHRREVGIKNNMWGGLRGGFKLQVHHVNFERRLRVVSGS
ncbi:hypothetical protein [Geotalea sp. SG265]|uniref:hypothetical protein n=1 Tax=Geotalea sp. SG265 TaxID=2922867 RepID=UPI001FAF4013|nr:hypothetical protein [Geotalea sp. SG265]